MRALARQSIPDAGGGVFRLEHRIAGSVVDILRVDEDLGARRSDSIDLADQMVDGRRDQQLLGRCLTTTDANSTTSGAERVVRDSCRLRLPP
jgi:hypothetical protein